MNNSETVRILSVEKVDMEIKKKTDFILMSGASEYVVSTMEYLTNIELVPKITVELANENMLSSTHRRLVNIDRVGTMPLSCKAYHIPDLNLNLLSCSRSDNYSCATIIAQGRCIFINRNDIQRQIGVLKKRGSEGLFIGQITISSRGNIESLYTMRTAQKESSHASIDGSDELGHKRLAHVNMTVLKEMITSSKYRMNIHDMQSTQNCETCVMTKSTKQKSTGSLIESLPDRTIYADICEPLQSPCYGSNRYFLSITMTRKRYLGVHLLNKRGDVSEHCHNFIPWIESSTSVRVKRYHSDNAAEYLALKESMTKRGVTSTTSSAYTPQLNGLA